MLEPSSNMTNLPQRAPSQSYLHLAFCRDMAKRCYTESLNWQREGTYWEKQAQDQAQVVYGMQTPVDSCEGKDGSGGG